MCFLLLYITKKCCDFSIVWLHIRKVNIDTWKKLLSLEMQYLTYPRLSLTVFVHTQLFLECRLNICDLLCTYKLYCFLQVGNHQPNDVMEYSIKPKTEFQHYIRLNRQGKPT
jgi:hypothetical protein